MDYAGRAADAHTQAQQPILNSHLNENRQSSGDGLQAVVEVSWRTDLPSQESGLLFGSKHNATGELVQTSTDSIIVLLNFFDELRHKIPPDTN